MDVEEIFAASARERRSVAEFLEGLDESDLATPSLCAGWDVRTVAGHLASAVASSKAPFVIAVLRAGGNLHRANDIVARRAARQPVAVLIETLRRYADVRFAPPVIGPRGPLTDLLVHGGDMRLPLGVPHEPPHDAVREALQFVTTGRPVGFVPRGRLGGVRLVADDVVWSWGTGPSVSGRGIDVLMAACGRAAAMSRLNGPGVAPLRERLPA